jgi:predicted ester cyclase
MTSRENKATVQRYVDEVMNGRSRTAVEDMLSSPMLAGHIKAGMDTIEGVFSELRYVVDALVEEGDTVAVFCTLYGKHTGEFQTRWITVPATGRDVMIPYAYRFRVEGERIVSLVGVSDFLQMLAQITAEEPSQ